MCSATAQNRTPAGHRSRPLDTFRSETYILGAEGRCGASPFPPSRSLVDMVDGRVIIQSQEDWTPAGSRHSLPGRLPALGRPRRSCKADPAHPKPTLIYAPGPARGARRASASTKDVLLVSILDNVRGRTLLFTPAANGMDALGDGRCPTIRSVGVVDASDTDDRR